MTIAPRRAHGWCCRKRGDPHLYGRPIYDKPEHRPGLQLVIKYVTIDIECEYYFHSSILECVRDGWNRGMFTTLTAGESTPMPWRRILDLLPILSPPHLAHWVRLVGGPACRAGPAVLSNLKPRARRRPTPTIQAWVSAPSLMVPPVTESTAVATPIYLRGR